MHSETLPLQLQHEHLPTRRIFPNPFQKTSRRGYLGIKIYGAMIEGMSLLAYFAPPIQLEKSYATTTEFA